MLFVLELIQQKEWMMINKTEKRVKEINVYLVDNDINRIFYLKYFSVRSWMSNWKQIYS